MGFFESIEGAHFKKDQSGRAVFYPWGAGRRGYLVPDEESERKARRIVRSRIMITGSVVIGQLTNLKWFFVSLAVFVAWFYIRTSALVSGWPVSGEGLTTRESYTNVAKGHNPVFLWAVLIGCLFFFALSIFLVKTAPAGANTKPIILTGVLLAGCAAVMAYMLSVRGKTDGGSGS